MERLDGGSAVPDAFRGGIVALGNFDGFHKGHQAVVGRAVARARAEGRPALVATFDPHPVRFFKPDLPPFRLTTLDQRERLFAAAGADAMLVFHFGAELAAGHRARFRHRLSGQPDRRGGRRDRRGFHLRQGPRRQCRGAEAARPGQPPLGRRGRAGRRRRRAGLLDAASARRSQAGDCETAARLLTRPFAIEGVVEHGDKRGRDARLSDRQYRARPLSAAALRRLCGARPARRTGACSTASPISAPGRCSIRPGSCSKPYFFDFDGDLYDQAIEVELIAFLRDEAVFDGLDALKARDGAPTPTRPAAVLPPRRPSPKPRANVRTNPITAPPSSCRRRTSR